MKTNTFDIRRFWQTLKWTVLTEKKSILTALLAFIVGFLAIQLFSCFTIFDLTQGLGRDETFAGMLSCLVILTFMQYYYASGLLGNARTSRQRVTVLMLPASNLEKFTARLVYCCVFMPLLLFVAFACATAVRVLLELLAGHVDVVWGFSHLRYHFGPDLVFKSSHVCAIWSVSLFVLGGVFFRQRPFVWTNITLFVGSMVLFTLLFYIGALIGEEKLGQMDLPFDFDTFVLVVNLILVVFTVFNVWLSYRLYCRLQVVQHKWFNV